MHGMAPLTKYNTVKISSGSWMYQTNNYYTIVDRLIVSPQWPDGKFLLIVESKRIRKWVTLQFPSSADGQIPWAHSAPPSTNDIDFEFKCLIIIRGSCHPWHCCLLSCILEQRRFICAHLARSKYNIDIESRFITLAGEILDRIS